MIKTHIVKEGNNRLPYFLITMNMKQLKEIEEDKADYARALAVKVKKLNLTLKSKKNWGYKQARSVNGQ